MKTELIEYHQSRAKHWRALWGPENDSIPQKHATFHEQAVAWLESLIEDDRQQPAAAGEKARFEAMYNAADWKPFPDPEDARNLLSALADELDVCEGHFGIGRAGDELILRDVAQACRAVLARKESA